MLGLSTKPCNFNILLINLLFNGGVVSINDSACIIFQPNFIKVLNQGIFYFFLIFV